MRAVSNLSETSETGSFAFHLRGMGLFFGRAIMASWQWDTQPSRGFNFQDHVNFLYNVGHGSNRRAFLYCT
jgi:hypothetical protein